MFVIKKVYKMYDIEHNDKNETGTPASRPTDIITPDSGLTVLSLFDGMANGALALHQLGIPVAEYHAYEIDPQAILIADHNIPNITRHGDGDVFKADFSIHRGVDMLIGGSPCTHWSIAQKKEDREVNPNSGIGWELFSQYVRALHEAQPSMFLYENNASMSDAIREEITRTFGFPPHRIQSSTLSAQSRDRLYWVGRRTEDGTYQQVPVPQPDDLGLVVADILEDGWTSPRDKAHAVLTSSARTTHREFFQKAQGDMAMRPVSPDTPIRVGDMPAKDGHVSGGQAMRVYSTEGKSRTQMACGGGMGGKTGLYAIPVGTTKDDKACTIKAQYSKNSVANFITNGKYNATGVAEPSLKPAEVDGETVFPVSDGMITIRGRQYPCKLPDGAYEIRKLTVRECARLQTIPEWYDFSVVSNTNAYKAIGNGWTVSVIAHIMSCMLDG